MISEARGRDKETFVPRERKKINPRVLKKEKEKGSSLLSLVIIEA